MQVIVRTSSKVQRWTEPQFNIPGWLCNIHTVRDRRHTLADLKHGVQILCPNVCLAGWDAPQYVKQYGTCDDNIQGRKREALSDTRLKDSAYGRLFIWDANLLSRM